jgi:NAD(P)-dependent dehydrogenase (short-subunit alcohol dehydrogenase family)
MTATTVEATKTATKVALITGGNRGLGFATARLLGQAGVTIVIAARDEERSREAVVALRSEKSLWMLAYSPGRSTRMCSVPSPSRRRSCRC